MNTRVTRGMLLAAAAALALTGAACGSDDDNGGGGGGAQADQPSRLAIGLSGSGKNARFEVPKSVPGGVATIEFTNSTGKMASAQLGYADGGHTGQEALAAAGAWAEQGKPLPPWAHTAGGTGRVEPGATATVTQDLPPGEYFVLDLEAQGRDETAGFFKVSGAGDAQLPEPASRVDAFEYRFEASGLKAGANRVLFDNKGKEPHFLEAAPIAPGKTIADVKRFLRTEKGQPPIDFERSLSTPVIDGGLRQVVELELDSGKYALLCFVPDRKGGPPHAVKGMISEATVGG
ncbi:MAG TPA: hypothetical protein VG126_02055 [Thermoleophilaceae bacterium]|jgi:hypothetical protein|nr:hypothetical protein [Thermoleophilaceae bacterium]